MSTVSTTGSVEYYAAVIRHHADSPADIRIDAISLIDAAANVIRTGDAARLTLIRNILTAAEQVEAELRAGTLDGFLREVGR